MFPHICYDVLIPFLSVKESLTDWNLLLNCGQSQSSMLCFNDSPEFQFTAAVQVNEHLMSKTWAKCSSSKNKLIRLKENMKHCAQHNLWLYSEIIAETV